MIDIRLPDLAGKTFLDLGGYRGDYAKLALDRGATSATVVDNQEWRRYGWPVPEQHPGVRYTEGDLMDWDEPADVVLCSNVIYHAKDPFAMLAHLRKLTKGVLLLRTSFVDEGDERGWHWYQNGLGHPNGTVWCRPTPEGLVKALREAGFKKVTEQGREGDHVVVEAS